MHLPDTGFYFAVKSNHYPGVSREVLACGFGLDVSSGEELKSALELGAADIVFSGPGKTDAELDLALAHSHKVVVLMDSFSELNRLKSRAVAQNVTINAGVRLSTEPAGLWRKFGIPMTALGAFMETARACPHIRFQGLQFHSSWNMTPAKQIDIITALGRTLADLSAQDRECIRFLDIGGGYWPEQGEWCCPPAGGNRHEYGSAQSITINRAAPITLFAEALADALQAHILNRISCRICFEPGRWICNDAMHILLQVMDKKDDALVITDGGTNTVGWERFETDYFPVLNLSRPEMTEHLCLVLGSLCTPHDVWGYGYWGREIREGDILMIPTQGAYTYSLRQHFIKPVPPVLSVRQRKPR